MALRAVPQIRWHHVELEQLEYTLLAVSAADSVPELVHIGGIIIMHKDDFALDDAMRFPWTCLIGQRHVE